MAASAPAMLTPEEAARRHPAPVITETKLRRLALLSRSGDPKVRESVASGLHTPLDVRRSLVTDPDAGVRGCLARNETTPLELLRTLAEDESETVRGWVAVNGATPGDVIDLLAGDDSDTVRRLVGWRRATLVG